MRLDSGRLLYEIPASTISIFGKNLPICGGGYLRHSPLWYTCSVMKKLNKEGKPAVVYVHPWELDNELPRLKGLTFFQKYRQYGSISTLMRKLEALLNEFEFGPAKVYIDRMTRKPIGFERNV